MDEKQIRQMAANARGNALKDAAKAVCEFCRNGHLWGAAQCVDGPLYKHLGNEPPHNLVSCAASAIWKLVDKE